MKLTNKLGLPDTFYRAVLNDKYTRGDSDYSATDLTAPLRVTILNRRHDDEVVEDVADRIWSLFGTALHSILEQSNPDNALTEERLFMRIAGRTISGATDLYEATRLITDYKSTSAWTIVYRSRIEEWTQQLNVYAELYEQHGFPVEKIQCVVMLRDWSKSKARADGKYPQTQVVVVPLELWPQARRRAWIAERVEALVAAEEVPDADLPECTPAEIWEKPTKYAVKKAGRKSALRVLFSMEEAQQWAAKEGHTGPGITIEVRPGERTRCEDYCPVNPWCSQFQAHTKAKESNVSHSE